VVDVPALGKLHRTTARSQALLDRALRLRQMSALVDGDDSRFTAHGEMVGDSSLRLILSTGEDSQLTWARFTRPGVLPSLLPLRPWRGARRNRIGAGSCRSPRSPPACGTDPERPPRSASG